MESVSAKVDIDLSVIGETRTRFDGAALFDHNGEVAEIEFAVGDPIPDALDPFRNASGMGELDGLAVCATLDDGRTVRSTVAITTKIQPAMSGNVTRWGNVLPGVSGVIVGREDLQRSQHERLRDLIRAVR